MQIDKKIHFANSLRGIAALCVLFDHYCGGFWLFPAQAAAFANSPINDKPMPTYLTFFWPSPVVQWGAFGVALFFLISGYVIPISLRRYKALGFLIGRIFRIYPTYMACFSVTVISLWVSTLFYGKIFPYTFFEVLIHFVPGLRDLMWSRHIDGIVWTLEIELKFYVICAIIAPSIRIYGNIFLVTPLILGSTAIIANFFLPLSGDQSNIQFRILTIISVNFQMICFMFIGSLLQFYQGNRTSSSRVLFLIPATFFIFLLSWSTGPLSIVIDRAWSYGAAVLVFAVALITQTRVKWNYRFLEYFSSISYPLYVVHGVFGFVILSILLGYGFKAWMSLLITSAAAISLATVIHKMVETPTQKWGRHLARFGINHRPAGGEG